MISQRIRVTAVCGLALAALGIAPAGTATAAPSNAAAPQCSSGAHTLSHFGDHVYPETGNGGYRSLHTDVHMVYDAKANQFLPGNHVELTVRAMQCLTDFSLDFERTSVDKNDGPKMDVNRILVDGGPAAYKFVQPTYPGDPKGQDDPDPRAHQAGQVVPVGGKDNNPLPPACTPAVTGNDVNAQNGDPCPANKLVITPPANIKPGTLFKVTVFYTGRPGVHIDGDGSTEGWFRNNEPPGDGGFVTTEPVGTEDWMPLNNHPSAKPTYDFYDTVTAGRTAIANGMLLSTVHNAPDALFREGSSTFHWHSPAPIANYLVENSVGNYDLSWRDADDGIRYYEAQASAIDDAQQQANLAIMDQQQDITDFQSQFNGPFPFTSDGVLVGIPEAGFEEEMQTMITFQGGSIGLRTFHHENMHQWWGDNVTEANYNLTFFKEGMATLGEYLFNARNAQTAAGGAGTPAGDAAFEQSLVDQFNRNYANTGSLWTAAPSDPTPARLFAGSTTYTRPGTAYVALRQILGKANFTSAMQQIQHDFGGASITEAQLEAAFHAWMPDQSAACSSRLDAFFAQWFDTVYASGGGANRPQITGPGLAGPGFYNANGTCD
jgi:Peptidase family M1 domain